MAEQTFSSAKDLLRNTVVGTVLPRREVISVETTTSIAEVYQLLVTNQILSVPVRNRTLRRYTALVDLLDIVCYVAETTGDISKALEDATAEQLADASGRNRYRAVEGNANLDNSLKLMLNGKLHRLAILDDESNLDSLLTQSHVVRFLAPHAHLFSCFSQTVDELQLGIREVFTVPLELNMRECLHVIKEKGVSAVGVVDGDGKLVNVVSVSDMRMFVGVDGFKAERLDLTVGEFVALRTEKASNERVIPGLICVQPSTTVEELMLKVVATHVHRLFVMDPATGAPIGVVALYDILDLLVKSQE